MKKPVLIIIDGPNGAGKTTEAKVFDSNQLSSEQIAEEILKDLG
jgi:predicted ABC-type ATPase